MVYKRILLIDDDEDDQDFFVEAVDALTHSAVVTILDNGIEALKRLSAKQIIADLIFLDLNMPLMNGHEFLVAIRKDPLLKNIPIIIFSTSGSIHTIESTKELGAMDFIHKPTSPDQLTQILRPFLIPAN